MLSLRKVGKALDKAADVFTEHFYGMETSNYYRNQRDFLKQTESLKNIGNPELHKYSKRELWWRSFETVSMKTSLTALQYLGLLTLSYQPFSGDPQAGWRAICGLGALLIPELARNFYANPCIREVKDKTVEGSDNVGQYLKTLKTSKATLKYVQC